MEAVRPSASYELVLEQVRRAIQLGRFGPGEKLPPERELSQQLGVSRTTVREAMRVLQGEGLIVIRRGRAGGAIVVGSSLTPAEAKRHLRQNLDELRAVFDYRLIVEPAAARLAAERRTKRDVSRLKSLVDLMSQIVAASDTSETAPPSRFFAVDAEYHHLIAEATRNPMLVGAVETARSAIFAPVGGIFPQLHRDANELHEEIFEAIADQNVEQAADAMTRHIKLTESALRELAGLSTRG